MSPPGKPGALFPLLHGTFGNYLTWSQAPDLLLWHREFLELFSHFYPTFLALGMAMSCLPLLSISSCSGRDYALDNPIAGLGDGTGLSRINKEPDEAPVCLQPSLLLGVLRKADPGAVGQTALHEMLWVLSPKL